MSHYFYTPEDTGQRHLVRTTVWGRPMDLVSAPGVFSAHRLDIGTSVLLAKTTPPPDDRALHLLDLGCGFGPITTALGLACPRAQIDAVDVNGLALKLTMENARRHQIAERVVAASPSDLPEHDYDEIWSNPPIRIGKEGLHEMLGVWLPRLRPGGQAWLVVGKNLGADSLRQWLDQQGWPTTRHASAKGFRVLRIERKSD